MTILIDCFLFLCKRPFTFPQEHDRARDKYGGIGTNKYKCAILKKTPRTLPFTTIHFWGNRRAKSTGRQAVRAAASSRAMILDAGGGGLEGADLIFGAAGAA